MTFAQGFYEYFRGCPLFDKQNRMNFNYRGVAPAEYNIIAPPAGQPIKQYLSGSTICEKPVTISSVVSYGPDARVQIQNSAFFETFSDWIREQNASRNFPETPEGTYPVKLECVTDGYLYTNEENTAQYQIQLKLTYKQGGKR